MTDWAQYAREVQACSDSSYRHQEKIIAGLRAEITQLRAELAEERELADRTMRALAESRNWNWIDLEDDRDSCVDVDALLTHLVDLDHEISEILTAHATRRNK